MSTTLPFAGFPDPGSLPSGQRVPVRVTEVFGSVPRTSESGRNADRCRRSGGWVETGCRSVAWGSGCFTSLSWPTNPCSEGDDGSLIVAERKTDVNWTKPNVPVVYTESTPLFSLSPFRPGSSPPHSPLSFQFQSNRVG